MTQAVAALGLPVFVKPARAGSSLGISKVDDLADLPRRSPPRRSTTRRSSSRPASSAERSSAPSSADAGRAAPGVPAGEIVVTGEQHDFYDFEAKYLDEAGVELSCPADLPEHLVERVREIAVRTFEAVGAEGLSRVDVFVTPDEQVVVNEINTMPGFTPFSMYPACGRSRGSATPTSSTSSSPSRSKRPTGLR